MSMEVMEEGGLGVVGLRANLQVVAVIKFARTSIRTLGREMLCMLYAKPATAKTAMFLMESLKDVHLDAKSDRLLRCALLQNL